LNLLRAATQEGEQMAAIDHKDIEDAIWKADHKAITLQGMMRSPLGRQKTKVIEGLIKSLTDDTGDLVCAIFEARSQDRQNAN
jgi:formyltetrahydrofolate synthetase